MIGKNGYLRFALPLCLLALLFAYSCKTEKQMRTEMRGKLDAEFEKQTAELMKEAIALETVIENLVEDQEKLAVMHEEFDRKLGGEKLSPEDFAIQQRHFQWETNHTEIIIKAKELIKKFKERSEEHEEMEESHGTVPLEEIEKEHEQFEDELKEFRDEFDYIQAAIEEAIEQTKTILQEHETLDEKY